VTEGYETDFHRWAETQAGLLRARSANALDWDNLAEEIAALAKNDQRDLASRIQTILDHLIRLRASPATDPRRGWERILIVQRDGIHKLLADSPSLRPTVASRLQPTPSALRITVDELRSGQTLMQETHAKDLAAVIQQAQDAAKETVRQRVERQLEHDRATSVAI